MTLLGLRPTYAARYEGIPGIAPGSRPHRLGTPAPYGFGLKIPPRVPTDPKPAIHAPSLHRRAVPSAGSHSPLRCIQIACEKLSTDESGVNSVVSRFLQVSPGRKTWRATALQPSQSISAPVALA